MKHSKTSVVSVLFSIALAIAAFILMGYNGRPLTHYAETPYGILNLELPNGGQQKVAAILQNWGADGKAIAWENCCFDFLFMVLYSFAFAMALKWLKENKTGRTASIAGWLFGIAFWPAMLDIIENVGMMYWLHYTKIPEWTVRLVTSASLFKWLLVIVIIGFSAIAVLQPSHKKSIS